MESENGSRTRKMDRRSIVTISVLLLVGLFFNVPFLQFMLRPDGVPLPQILVAYISICQVFILSAGIIMAVRRTVLGRLQMIRWMFFVVCLFFLGVLLGVVSRSVSLYRYAISEEKPGWSGRPFQSDSIYGLVNSPGAIAWELTTGQAPVPVRFSPEGFRVPLDACLDTVPARPTILCLGCSFTFGSGVTAEEAFPGLLGTDLAGTVMNAGVCSWGVAQMLRRSEDLIPVMRPDVVVFQYSPWLLSRTRRGFAPIYFGVLPTPYYSQGVDGSVHFCPPAFCSASVDLDLEPYSGQDAGIREFLVFTEEVAAPLLFHDDARLFEFRLREITGAIPRRLEDVDLIARHAYSSIAQLCERNGVQLVILRITNADYDPCWSTVLSVLPSDVLVADGETALWNALSQGNIERYQQEYWTWAGDPPQIVNAHPNASAHMILADCIVDVLTRSSPEAYDWWNGDCTGASEQE